MKRNNQHPALGRIRSLFSSLMLATVMAFSFSGCADKSEEAVLPTSKDASAQANLSITPTISHQIRVYFPNSEVLSINILHNGWQYKVARLGGGTWVGWQNTGIWVNKGKEIRVTWLKTSDHMTTNWWDIYERKWLYAPGKDGYTYWWVQP